MDDLENLKTPKIIQDILVKTADIGFRMVSDPLVGSLLNTLAMSKPSGRFLGLGTNGSINCMDFKWNGFAINALIS